MGYVNDRHAADAAYHESYNSNLRPGRQVPKCFQDENNKKMQNRGRPQSLSWADAFFFFFLRMADNLCHSNEEQTTIDDLIMRMNEYPEDEEEAYVAARKKESLLSHFGSDVLISRVKGKQNVVTFRGTAISNSP